MTTPAPQPPPAASGPDREDQAQQAGAAVGAAMRAAEAAILASVAAAILALIAGSLTVQMAKRKIRVAISSALGAAMRKAGPVIAALPPSAQQPIRQAVLNAQSSAMQSAMQAIGAATGKPQPGTPGQRQVRPGVGVPAQPQPDMSELAMQQLREAKGSKGGPFRDVTDAHQAAVKGAMAEKMSRLKQAQKAMDDLASQGITGFTDKAGRQWSLSSYAEMSTRTAASRLILQNQLKLMGPAGVTLAVVDDPSMTAPCPKCLPWQGRVIALAGSGTGSTTITDAHGTVRTEQIAGTLAEATAAGLFHPNCRCGLEPWHDGAALVPTVGGQRQGYVVAGQPVARALPITSPRYEDEQRLRGHERAVRAAATKVSTALTPQAKRAARVHLAARRAALEQHVRTTGVTRLPGRERPGRAR